MKHYLLISLALIAVSIGVFIGIKPKAHADADLSATNTTAAAISGASYNWVDVADIQAVATDGTKINFWDSNGIVDYLGNGTQDKFFGGNCTGGSEFIQPGQSTLLTDITTGGTDSQVQWKYLPPNSQQCYGWPSKTNSSPSFKPIKIGDPQNAKVFFTYAGGQINVITGVASSYTRLSSAYPNVYVQGSASTCSPEIVVSQDGDANLWPLTTQQGGQQVTDPATDNVGCYIPSASNPTGNSGGTGRGGGVHAASPDDGLDVAAAQQANAPNPSGSIPVDIPGLKYVTPGSPGSAAATTTPPPSGCNASPFSLAWLLCPFVEAVGNMIDWANTTIQSFLILPVNEYFSDACVIGDSSEVNCTTYQVWVEVRDISLSLLVIVALIMVIATALDVGPFSAYTVKKVLPRMIIAVIAISFSWEIGRLAVSLTNTIGAGVGQLILSPVYSTLPGNTPHTTAGVLQWIYTGSTTGGAATASATSSSGAGIIGWLVAGTLASAVGIAFIGPLAALMLLLPALLAFLLGLLIIIARQLIVVLCVIFSPLAFLAFVLPGTQRGWKIWQQSFFGALFMYPMIMGAISIGALLAFVIIAGSVTSPLGVSSLLAFIFIIAPYFLMPRIARMSSGALGSVANGLNSATQGINNGLKQAQRKKMADSFQKAKSGDLYHGYKWLPGSERIAKRMGGVTTGLGTGWSGHFGVGERGQQARHKALTTRAAERERSADNIAFKDFDDAQRAKTFNNATEAENYFRGLREYDRDAKGNIQYDKATGKAKLKRAKSDEDIKTAIEAARSSGGFGGAEAVLAAKNLEQSSTAYKDYVDADGNKHTAIEDMMRTNERVSGGNEALLSNLAAHGAQVTKQQRPDLYGGGVEASIALAKKVSRGQVGPGSKDFTDAVDRSIETAGPMSSILAQAKAGTSLEGFFQRQGELIKTGGDSDKPEVRQETRRKAAAALLAAHGNLSNATGEGADMVNEGLRIAGVDFSRPESVAQQLSAAAIKEDRGINGELITAGATDYKGQTLDVDGRVLEGLARTWGGGGSAQAPMGARGEVIQDVPHEPTPTDIGSAMGGG